MGDDFTGDGGCGGVLGDVVVVVVEVEEEVVVVLGSVRERWICRSLEPVRM